MARCQSTAALIQANSGPFVVTFWKMNTLNWKPVLSPGPITLRGRYVTLEPLDLGRHAAPLWEAVGGHDELWTWLANGPYAGASELMNGLDAWRQANQAIVLAIVPRQAPLGSKQPEPEGQAKGWASYMRIDPANGVVEVGNILFSPALKRTRAATEAMYLMAGHVFDHLGYRRYEWKCNALNEGSRRAALRFGFTYEGIFRQHMVTKDSNRDTAWFSMLDHEWPGRKRAFEAWLDPGNFDIEGRQQRSLPDIAAALG
jgi:RimJ/RimL family protein N-acetyltransferase